MLSLPHSPSGTSTSTASLDARRPEGEAFWHFTLRLACGHAIDRGVQPTSVCEAEMPTRQGQSHGECPQGCGQRRVLCASSVIARPAP